MCIRDRTSIINWWRAWVALWNLKILWNWKYALEWLKFIHDDKGKKFWRKHKKDWYEFFRKRFEKWIKNTNTQTKIFTTKGLGEVKKASRPLMEKWLEATWSEYITTKKIDQRDLPIPPLPPYKPLLLVGPPGSGKTTTAHALASDEGVIVIEFNASDERSKRIVDSIIKESSKSAGFFIGTQFPQKPPRIILLDEVDGISAQRDKGGFSALLNILEEIKLPPILTANVIHDPKVRRLMIGCITVFFDRPRDYEAKKLIKMIATRAKMDVPEDIMNMIIKYAPDFRSIVVALETYYYTGKLPTLWHDRMSSLQDAIRMAFGIKSRKNDLAETMDLARRYLQESGEDIPDLILTVWDNAWKFIDHRQTFGFYKAIADADYYYRVCSRRGNWRVAYLNSLNILSYSMAKYGKPSNIWALRKIRVNIPKIASLFHRLYSILRGETEIGRLVVRLSRYMHVSRRETIRTLPLIVHLAMNKPSKIGMLLARIGCSEATVEAFIEEFIKDKKIRKQIMEGYREYTSKISISTGKTTKAEKTQEKPIPKKEKNKERRKMELKPKKGTLDLFLK